MEDKKKNEKKTETILLKFICSQDLPFQFPSMKLYKYIIFN